jgi:PAS domain S-box-containing protein
MARLHEAISAADSGKQAADIPLTHKNKNKKELIEEINLLQKRIAVLDMQGSGRKLVLEEPRESEEHLIFETLISDLSARFVNIAPDRVDGEIENALKQVLEFFQVDRCGLLGTRPNKKMAFVTHAWYAGGIGKVAGDINLATLFPWRYEKLFVQGIPVSTAKMETLPPEAETDRRTYLAMGVRSSLDIPVLFRDQASHVIVIQSLRKERVWPEEYIPRLRLLGEIFINALERRNADRALTESEDRLSLATDAAGVMPWTIDMGSGRLWTTERAKEFFGFAPDGDMSLESFLSIVHPEDRDSLRRVVEETMQSGTDNKAEYRIVRPDGSIRWVLSRGRPYAASSGGSSSLVGVSADITERRRVDDALRENEERLRDITFSMADWIWEVDDNGIYTYSSAKGLELFGCVLGKTPFDFMPPDEAKRVAGIFSGIAANREPIKDLENWNITKDGERICLLTNGVPILDDAGNLKGYRGVDKDITDRKRAEAALKESQTQITAVMNSTKDFIWSVDPERFGLLTWNRAFRDYFLEHRGIELEVGMTPAELVPRDYVPLWQGLFSRALQEEFVIAEYVVVAQTKTLLLSLHAMRRDNSAFGISVFGRDITELKRAEKEIRAEKDKLQSIMSVMNTGITIRNPDYDLIYQNDYSLNTFGNHQGEKCYRVFAGIDRVCDDCPVEKSFKDGKSHSHVKEVEMLPGDITFWENTAVPMKDSDGNIYACLEINNNITERKKSEKALIESEAALRISQNDLQKLAGRLISAQEEELRRLSRELHDDLTQRLAVLAIEAGKLELGLRKMPEPCQETLETISEIKDQLIKVSEDVHNISRQLHPTILDDLGLVRAIESECAALMRRENIEIVFIQENVPLEIGNDIALCLYRVLQEGLKNVITHSRAMSCEIFLEDVDNLLCLTVSDNGVGFEPSEVRYKAGLGLSSMRERAQLVQGVFSIKSRPGQGTIVRVVAPLKAGCA